MFGAWRAHVFTLGGGVVVVGRCRLRRRPRVRLRRRTAGRFGIIVSASTLAGPNTKGRRTEIRKKKEIKC